MKKFNLKGNFKDENVRNLVYQNYFLFNANDFFIYNYFNFHKHLLVYCNFGPRIKQPNLFIFSPKFLYRVKIVNYIKNNVFQRYH